MKPESVRAPMSARKQTGISQQNPSGTAASRPQQSPDVRLQSKPVRLVTRRESLARLGASMYGHSVLATVCYTQALADAMADSSWPRLCENARAPFSGVNFSHVDAISGDLSHRICPLAILRGERNEFSHSLGRTRTSSTAANENVERGHIGHREPGRDSEPLLRVVLRPDAFCRPRAPRS
jgi:hypothetical protein